MALRLSSTSIFRQGLLALGALALGAVFAVVTIEIGLRAIGFGAVSVLAYGRDHYNPDLPEIGYAGRPNIHGIQTREGISEVRFNSHGFHDIEHDRTPDPDTYRVVVVGNSYTMAEQVPRADVYVSRLEKELTLCPVLAGRKIETINLGVDGYTIHQQYLVLLDYGLSLSPDLVVLQVNSFALAGDFDPLFNLSPRLVLHGDELDVDRAYLLHPEFRRRASRVAALIQQLSDRSRVLQYLLEVRRRAGQLSATSAKPAGAQALERYRSDRDMVVEQFAKLLRDLNIPWALTIVPTADDTTYSPERSSPMEIDWLNLAHRLGIPAIDVEQEARAEVRTTGRFLHGFGTTMTTGHLNRHGHAFFARALSAHLCEIITLHGAVK